MMDRMFNLDEVIGKKYNYNGIDYTIFRHLNNGGVGSIFLASDDTNNYICLKI